MLSLRKVSRGALEAIFHSTNALPAPSPTDPHRPNTHRQWKRDISQCDCSVTYTTKAGNSVTRDKKKKKKRNIELHCDIQASEEHVSLLHNCCINFNLQQDETFYCFTARGHAGYIGTVVDSAISSPYRLQYNFFINSCSPDL